MLDTNQVQQAADVAKAVAGQVQTNWPAISAAAFIAAREITNFNRWAKSVAEWVMSHGGIGYLTVKLLWNPPAQNPTEPKPAKS